MGSLLPIYQDLVGWDKGTILFMDFMGHVWEDSWWYSWGFMYHHCFIGYDGMNLLDTDWWLVDVQAAASKLRVQHRPTSPSKVMKTHPLVTTCRRFSGMFPWIPPFMGDVQLLRLIADKSCSASLACLKNMFQFLGDATDRGRTGNDKVHVGLSIHEDVATLHQH